MERVKLTKNLWLDEYVSRELYNAHPVSVLIGMLDKRLIYSDQALRDHFGYVTINNWYTGGTRNESGLRTFGSTIGALYSQHKYGRASDKIFLNATAEEVLDWIKFNFEKVGITCIEENKPDTGDMTWVHSDVRWVSDNKLKIVWR